MADVTSLKAQIKSGSLNNLYIFTGPEVKMIDIYLAQMSKQSGKSIKNLGSITDLVKVLHSTSFFKNAQIFVLRDCKEFLSDDKLQAVITQNKTNLEHIIVFLYTSIDKRSKLYKTMKDNIVEFEPMKEDVLVKYIKKDSPLDTAHCVTLISICENDYSRILLELDKIKTYAVCKNIDVNSSMDKLISEGTIYQPPKDAVFDFVDAVLRYKPKVAFRLLEDSYEYGEATMVLLANLYNSTKQLLQVQSYKGDNLSQSTGLTPFQIKLASGRRGYYSNGDLIYFMRTLREVEKRIKTGTIDESMAVQYALVCLWG